MTHDLGGGASGAGASGAGASGAGASGRRPAAALRSDAMLLAAGAADLAITGLTSLLGSARDLLGRGDVPDLAAEGAADIRARGRLALDRLDTLPPAHLEVLAQHVLARRTAPVTAPGE